MDFALARRNMVESQLRTNKVTQEALLDAMRTVPREQFLPKRVQHLAYVDEDIPVGNDRFEVEPMILGRMVQALAISPNDMVLAIGVATGYTPAVLCRLAKTVFGVEEDEALAGMANAALTEHACDNAVIIEGALAQGYAKEAPYDAILVNGAVAEIPKSLVQHLKDDGRLVSVVRDSTDTTGRLALVTNAQGVSGTRFLADASVPYLTGFEPSLEFAF